MSPMIPICLVSSGLIDRETDPMLVKPQLDFDFSATAADLTSLITNTTCKSEPLFTQ